MLVLDLELRAAPVEGMGNLVYHHFYGSTEATSEARKSRASRRATGPRKASRSVRLRRHTRHKFRCWKLVYGPDREGF
jgi:hypothetical protein